MENLPLAGVAAASKTTPQSRQELHFFKGQFEQPEIDPNVNQHHIATSQTPPPEENAPNWYHRSSHRNGSGFGTLYVPARQGFWPYKVGTELA